MTKIILFLLLSLLSSNISNSQELHTRNTNWNKENLKGQVKSYIETRHKGENIYGFVVVTSCLRKEKFVFNKQGNLTGRLFYNCSIKNPYRQWTYRYDKEGNQVEFKECEISTLLPEKCITSEYIYKKKGNQIEVIMFEIREFFPEANDGKYVKKKWIYNYDTKTNLIKAEEFRGEDNLEQKITYTYDEKGNLTEENQVYNGKEHSKSTFKYSKSGNMIKEEYWCDYDDDLNKTFYYKYDEKGNVIEINIFSSAGDIIYKQGTNKYTYDEKGNWIKCVEYRTGRDVPSLLVLKRTYKYFD